MKPIMTGEKIESAESSSIHEKAKAAISNPLQKAIIVAIIDLGKLDNKPKTDPNNREYWQRNPKIKNEKQCLLLYCIS